MPEFQPVASAHVSAIKRPKCPKCRQNRMLLSKLEAGSSGFDHRTFECQKCGRIHRVVASRDPMTLDLLGGLASKQGRRPEAASFLAGFHPSRDVTGSQVKSKALALPALAWSRAWPGVAAVLLDIAGFASAA